ncbi:MAG: PLP-dependent aminotransferase family protein [Pseudomonadales bacterium]|nr:PLP-dependent aminotransferase family protein [Pseudomonadales bacterium]
MSDTVNIKRVQPLKTCLYQVVADEIVADIEQGLYQTGQKMLSVRQLSRKRQVSISTITQAYGLLEDRGYIQAKPQSGYFLRQLDVDTHTSPPLSIGRTPGPVTKSRQISTVLASCQQASSINFGAAIPALDLLPQRAIQSHIQKASRYQSDEMLSYQFSPGYMPLRAQIAQRMRNIGVRCHMDEIMITQGCTEALSLSLRANTVAGDMIAVESPCYYGFLQMAEMLGLKVIEIPTHSTTGMSIEALQLALQQWPIKLILLGSRFSNPTGSVMPEAHQRQLVSLVNDYQIKVVEDDIYGEIDFSGKNNTVLKTFDTQGRVLYCSSFSKTIAPGLRVGWCLPGKSQEQMQNLQMFNTFAAASLQQCAMATYLQAGSYDKHLRALKRTIKQNIDYFMVAIRQYFPATTLLSQPAGGFVLWLALAENISATELQTLALQENITLIPGSVFSNTQHFDNYIRLNCALSWNASIKNALKKLGELVMILEQQSL